MGEQGLAGRLAAENARNLTIYEELGDRLHTRLVDDRERAARSGIRLDVPNREFCRVLREYRTGLKDMRLQAILEARLKINVGEDPPMTEEEFREALEQLRREALTEVDGAELERELAGRPQVMLPPGSVVLDVESREAPMAPAYVPSGRHVPLRVPVEQSGDAPEAGEEQAQADLAPPPGPDLVDIEPEPGPDDEDDGFL